MRTLIVSIAIALFLPGCGSSDAPVETPVGPDTTPWLGEAHFSCGTWYTAPPPEAEWILADIQFGFLVPDSEKDPLDAGVALILDSGGRVEHAFHVRVVRAVLPVSLFPEFYRQGIVVWAWGVTDPGNLDQDVRIVFDRDLEPADVQAVEDLGGSVQSQFCCPGRIYAVMPDPQIPAALEIPGVVAVTAPLYGCRD